MGIYIGAVHVGNAIEKRMREIRLTQAELAVKLGMKQPQLSKIISKSSMDTEKLSAFCLALDFNFFKLFCPEEEKSEVNLSSVDMVPNNEVVLSLIRMLEKEREDHRKIVAEKDAFIKDLINGQASGIPSFEKTKERMVGAKP